MEKKICFLKEQKHSHWRSRYTPTHLDLPLPSFVSRPGPPGEVKFLHGALVSVMAWGNNLPWPKTNVCKSIYEVVGNKWTNSSHTQVGKHPSMCLNFPEVPKSLSPSFFSETNLFFRGLAEGRARKARHLDPKWISAFPFNQPQKRALKKTHTHIDLCRCAVVNLLAWGDGLLNFGCQLGSRLSRGTWCTPPLPV